MFPKHHWLGLRLSLLLGWLLAVFRGHHRSPRFSPFLAVYLNLRALLPFLFLCLIQASPFGKLVLLCPQGLSKDSQERRIPTGCHPGLWVPLHPCFSKCKKGLWVILGRAHVCSQVTVCTCSPKRLGSCEHPPAQPCFWGGGEGRLVFGIYGVRNLGSKVLNEKQKIASRQGDTVIPALERLRQEDFLSLEVLSQYGKSSARKQAKAWLGEFSLVLLCFPFCFP